MKSRKSWPIEAYNHGTTQMAQYQNQQHSYY